MRALSEQCGLSVAVVLHVINMVGRFWDDLIALKGGRLLTSGTSTELMQADTLAEIYGIPMGIVAHPHSGVPISFAH